MAEDELATCFERATLTDADEAAVATAAAALEDGEAAEARHAHLHASAAQPPVGRRRIEVAVNDMRGLTRCGRGRPLHLIVSSD